MKNSASSYHVPLGFQVQILASAIIFFSPSSPVVLLGFQSPVFSLRFSRSRLANAVGRTSSTYLRLRALGRALAVASAFPSFSSNSAFLRCFPVSRQARFIFVSAFCFRSCLNSGLTKLRLRPGIGCFLSYIHQFLLDSSIQSKNSIFPSILLNAMIGHFSLVIFFDLFNNSLPACHCRICSNIPIFLLNNRSIPPIMAIARTNHSSSDELFLNKPFRYVSCFLFRRSTNSNTTIHNKKFRLKRYKLGTTLFKL